MFLGCPEISISFIKHVQHVWIIRTFCLPGGDLLSFSVPEGTEKIGGLWFARGNQYPGWYYGNHFCIMVLHEWHVKLTFIGIKAKGEYQNGGNKKTKHDKFSEKRTFLTSWYTYVCVRIRVQKMLVFRKVWRAFFSYYLRFEIRIFALIPKHWLHPRNSL